MKNTIIGLMSKQNITQFESIAAFLQNQGLFSFRATENHKKIKKGNTLEVLLNQDLKFIKTEGTDLHNDIIIKFTAYDFVTNDDDYLVEQRFTLPEWKGGIVELVPREKRFKVGDIIGKPADLIKIENFWELKTAYRIKEYENGEALAYSLTGEFEEFTLTYDALQDFNTFHTFCFFDKSNVSPKSYEKRILVEGELSKLQGLKILNFKESIDLIYFKFKEQAIEERKEREDYESKMLEGVTSFEEFKRAFKGYFQKYPEQFK